jgi:predicted MFS family arabinose efflux permease
MLPLAMLIAIGSPIMGGIAARIGPRWPLTLGPLLVAGGFALALRIDAGAAYWPRVFPAVLLLAGGMAVAVAPLTTSVLASVEESHVGTASGLNSAVARIGGLIATALLGLVLGRSGEASVAAFHGSLFAGGATAVAAGLFAWLMLGDPRSGRGT